MCVCVWGGGGGCPHLSDIPLRGTKVLFCGRGLKFFSPLRGMNKNILTDALIIFNSNRDKHALNTIYS